MVKGENSIDPLSIIIPCLNEEQYIGVLLSCLANQTFQDFEVIIVDGRSHDNTRGAVDRVVSRFPALQGKVRFVEADKKGAAHQRNYGANLATYERLLFFDADLQIPFTFLQDALTELHTRDLKLATALFSPISERIDDKVIFFIGNVYIQIQQVFQPVAMGFCIFSTKTIHTSIGGFDEGLKLGEDYDYVRQATKLGNKFKVLTNVRSYVSIRRLKKEGRLTYYTKAVLSEVISFVAGHRQASEIIEYDFGTYDQPASPRVLKFDKKNDA